ncbi:MAG: hypothetical protein AAFX99_04670 [Myxococcota bacterium]
MRMRWVNLCTLFLEDSSPAWLDIALPYALAHLEGWPESVRTAPERWRLAWEQGNLPEHLKALVPRLDTGLLPASGGGAYPVQYDIEHEGRGYYLRYRWGGFSITLEYDRHNPNAETDVDLLHADIGGAFDGDWTHEETNVMLHKVSRAIREGTLAQLSFDASMDSHPQFCTGIYPLYVGIEPETTLAAWNLDLRGDDLTPAQKAFLSNT